MPTITKYEYGVSTLYEDGKKFFGRISAFSAEDLDRRVRQAATCDHEWMELEPRCIACSLVAIQKRTRFRLPKFGFQ